MITTLLLSTNLVAKVEFSGLIKQGLRASPEYSKFKDFSSFEKTLETSKYTNLFLPKLTASFLTSKENGFNDEEIIDSQQLQLNAKYSLFSFGSDYNSYKGQKFALKSFRANSSQALFQEEEKITDVILNFIKLNQELKSLDNIISLKKKLYTIAKKKYQSGSLSKNDFIRVKVDLADTKSQRITQTRRLLELRNTLYSYSIFRKDLKPNFPWAAGFQKYKLSKISKLNLNINNTPIIQAAQYDLQSFTYKHDAIRREYFGNFSLNLSRNIYKVQDDGELYGWSGSIIYTLPIFENYEHKVRIENVKANIILKNKTLKYQKENLKNYISDQKLILADSLENFLLLTEIEKDLRYLLKNLQRRYQKGLISTSNLFLEQDRILLTQNNLILANYNLHQNYLRVLHLHGKSITEEPDLIFE
jgi:outer membrane protein TolC